MKINEIKALLKTVLKDPVPGRIRLEVITHFPLIIDQLVKENEVMREALEKIKAPKYGLQGIVEDGLDGTQREVEYWAQLVRFYENDAGEALKEVERIESGRDE